MKKTIAFLLAASMILGLSSCAAPQQAAPAPAASEAGASAEAPADSAFVFKHGFDLDYPPYSFIDENGKTGGFDVEMAQAVCDYYGWQYEAVPFNWDAKDAELNAGSCDCIWSGFTVNGREDDYLWSKAYSDNTQMIMVAKDSGSHPLPTLQARSSACRPPLPPMIC